MSPSARRLWPRVSTKGGFIEVRLQQLVERLGAAPAAIDRRQDLDVVDRVEAEPLGDAVEDQVEQLGLGISGSVTRMP